MKLWKGYGELAVVGERQSPTPSQAGGAADAARADAGPVQSDSLTALAVGTRVNRYEIISVLGQGSFGITYRAVDTQLDRAVALKEYLPTTLAVRQPDLMVLPRSTQLANDFRWGRERFLAEAKTLARLSDAPGVVDVFDYLEANGTGYMVMALVQGETLEARLIREGRLERPAIERIVYPLLDGLEIVHRAGFLHRDIKPGNILIDAAGRPTLIDFGAAREALQGRTQALTAIYTPGYAAFEQFTSAHLGPWTDIYALGATLYHCVRGAPPPPATDRMRDDKLVPASEAGRGRYPRSLLTAIDAALKLREPERPQDIFVWRCMLSGVAEQSTIDLSGPPPHRPDEPTRLRTDALAHPAAVGRPQARRNTLIVCSLLLIAAGVGGWMMLRASPEPGVDPQRGVEQAQGSNAAEQKARADAEARRRAEEKAAAEVADRRKTEEETARRRRSEEQARADAEARRKAEEKAAAEVAERRKAEDEAARRRQTEEKPRADAEARRKAEEKAAAEAAERRKAEDEAAKRQQAEEQSQADAEARRKASEEKAAAEAAERRRAEDEAATRRQTEERARAEAEARRRAEEEARERANTEARRTAEAAEQAAGLSERDRRRVQVALRALGLDAGGVDGAFGPRTRQMIEAWQQRHGYPPTGYLTPQQYAALQKEAETALAQWEDQQKRLQRQRPPAGGRRPEGAPSPAPSEAPQDVPSFGDLFRKTK